MELAYHQSRRSFIGRTGGLATACAVMAGLPGAAAQAQPAAAKPAAAKPAAADAEDDEIEALLRKRGIE